MRNKILINLIVPTLNKEYEVFIPVNERIVRIKELLVKAIVDLSDIDLDKNKIYSLLYTELGTIYDSRLSVKETNIKNAKKLIMF